MNKAFHVNIVFLQALLFVFAASITHTSIAAINTSGEEIYLSCSSKDKAYAPVKVYVTLQILNIRNLNLVDHTFETEFYLGMYWDPDNAKHLAVEKVSASEWRPVPDFINAVNIDYKAPTEFEKIKKSSKKHGYTARYIGTFISPMNLSGFPFDRHQLQIVFEELSHAGTCIQYIAINDRLSFTSSSSLGDWIIDSKKSSMTVAMHKMKAFGNEKYSRVTATIHIARKAQQPYYKIVSVSIIISLITLIAFSLSPRSLGKRIAISLTSLLVLSVQIHLTLDSIPKIPYLTALNMLQLGTQMLVFISAIGHVVVFRIYSKSSYACKDKLCKVIDRISILTFCLILIALFAAYQYVIIQAQG